MGVEPKWTLCLFELQLCAWYSFLPHEGSIWSLMFCEGKCAALVKYSHWRTKNLPKNTFLGQFEISELIHECVYVNIYIHIIYIYTENNYKHNTCFCPHFSWAELKDLRLFLCTQKAYFSQILFTNLSKSVLVSTSPLPRQYIHLIGVAYQDAD